MPVRERRTLPGAQAEEGHTGVRGTQRLACHARLPAMAEAVPGRRVLDVLQVDVRRPAQADAFSSSRNQISLRVGKAGTAWRSRATGTSPTTAIVAACRKSAISAPTNVAPTTTPRPRSITRRLVPAALRP